MVFNSLTFLVFFALVLGVDRALGSWTARKAFLLVASYAFYAAWSPPLVILLWISTATDWWAVKRIVRARTARERRAWLLVSLCVNLGLLGYFKYASFLLESCADLLALVGVQYTPPATGIVLPVGISFYTFQTLSYSIDAYRDRSGAWRSPLDFALYVTFFPQLVAGPIVRARDFEPQLLEPRRASGAQLDWGMTLLTFGLFEKVILADGILAPVADHVFGRAPRAGFADAWIGTFAFSGQILLDFSGYSTCAIGAALCLGFHLPDNFRRPYAAVGFSDFWRRWHISLSSWLRDYLYIPLGGNRRGEGRTYVHLLATMLLGGLWHGASWMFVIWGALHGLLLALERRLGERFGASAWTRSPAALAGLALLTYLLVCVTWVFFRARDMESATGLVAAMFGAGARGSLLGAADLALVGGVTLGLLATQWHWRETSTESIWERAPHWLQVGILALLLLSLILSKGDDRAFLYFQF